MEGSVALSSERWKWCSQLGERHEQRLTGWWGPGDLDSPGKGGDVGGAKQGCDKVGSHAAAVVEVRRGEAEAKSLGRRLGSCGTQGGSQRSSVGRKDLMSLENHQSVRQQTQERYFVIPLRGRWC